MFSTWQGLYRSLFGPNVIPPTSFPEPSFLDCQRLVMQAPYRENMSCLSAVFQATTPGDITRQPECGGCSLVALRSFTAVLPLVAGLSCLHMLCKIIVFCASITVREVPVGGGSRRRRVRWSLFVQIRLSTIVQPLATACLLWPWKTYSFWVAASVFIDKKAAGMTPTWVMVFSLVLFCILRRLGSCCFVWSS